MKLVNIGFGNIIALERVISIVSPESAPIKRLVQEAKEETKEDEQVEEPKEEPKRHRARKIED